MEEKKLTEKESLELIAQMIQSTKENIEKGSGTYLLIFGYTSIFVALFIYTVWKTTGNPLIFWSWWLIAIIGYGLSYLKRRNSPNQVVTGVDRVIGKVWIVAGLCCCISPVVSLFVAMPILFVEALIVSMATTMLGLIIKAKVIYIPGFISIGLSYSLLFADNETCILIFAALFVILMVIPGHLLNAIAAKSNN